MCLGIPAQVIGFVEERRNLARRNLAKVDVQGVTRTISVDLLEGEPLAPGDWVLVHVGFAMARIDEEEAALAIEALRLLGQAYEDELASFRSSRLDAAEG